MEIRDPKAIKKIAEARKLVEDLQLRLFRCEQALDDLARSAEIADITKQTHLMTSFVEAAQVCLEDRLTLPEISEEDLNRPVTIIHDDREKVST
jgi:hypothetical protein